MSKNTVYSPSSLKTTGTGGPDAAHLIYSKAFPSSVPNISPRPPVFFVTTGQKQLLNYSFQTGEEFALEFMQDRANARKPLVPIISDDRTINTSYIPWKEEDDNSQDKPSKKLLKFPSFSETSSQESNKRNPQEIYSSGSTDMKFLCNFGGRFLPRPIDGMLRYVGGEKHLVRVSRGMSLQGLVSKTTKLIRQAHIIKYHLPGEQVNVLISVASDDDVHHMIDECIVLEEINERPAMYLFTDEDDEHHVHFAVGSSSDEDTEAQYIALINGYGYTGTGEKLSGQGPGSASASDLDQLMFDIEDEGSLTGRTEEASAHIRNKCSQNSVTAPPKASRIPLHKMPRIFNQDSAVCSDKGEVSSYSARKSRNVNPVSSMPSEFTYPAKWDRYGGNATSRQLPEMQRTTTNMSKIDHYAERDKESRSSRTELLIPSDDNSLRMPSLNSKYSSQVPHTSDVNKLLRKQTEPIIQFIQSNNSTEFQKLMTEEPVGRAVHVMLASPSGDYEKLAYKCLSSDESMIYTRRCSPQEDTILCSDTAQLGKIRNSQLHDRTELPARSQSSGSNEAGAHILYHDNTQISVNPYTHEQLFIVNTTGNLQLPLPDVMCSGATKKDISSIPIVYDSETVHSPRPFTSSDSKAAELQKNNAVHASRDKQEASPSSGRQDVELSTIVLPPSPGGDGNRMQAGAPSEEVIENAAAPISEFEVHGTRDNELALPSNASLGRDIISNVQIISNEDLEDLQEMGSGAFGTVFHGRWKGTDVAIKRIKNSCFMYPSPGTDKLIAEFWREAAILSKLHHPNVLAFYGIVNNGPGGTLATVTEFMASGSLKKVLLHKEKFLDRRKRITLAMDAAIGMEYMHSKDIIHFDLKSDNLLVNLNDPSRPICKVADFGLSKVKQTTMVSGEMRGTLPWMAPEMLEMSSNRVSAKVDVYSFGIIMWEILTGQEPYCDMHHGGILGGILSNTLRPPVPASCDPEWKELMEQCWSSEPEKRPSFTEVVSRLRSMLEANQSKPLS
ncbi:serine/threonine-protein kinase STE20-like [Phragmites australis]|uniref:serine/threonine-protein kinase STE20-like n=1 Tax=Phragmites australis TaxID=29695 RepID=UPI002D77427C|nr:serine/threonine-protein kinase STE20-like [Phragmites australis]